MTDHGDPVALRHELDHVASSLKFTIHDGYVDVTSALTVLHEVMSSVSANVAAMEATPANIADIDGAIPSVRSELELAGRYIHQAIAKIEGVM